MDENGNVLAGGIENLKAFRDLVERNVNSKNQAEFYASEEKKYEKELNLNKKNLKENIEATVKKRRLEVARQYDDEMAKEEAKRRKIKDQRGDAKKKGIKERIADETAELCAQNKELKGNIRTSLKGERLAGFCGSPLYFALFMTKGIGEALVFILTVLVTCLLLPGGIFLLLPVDHDKKVMAGIILAVVYFVVIFLFVCIYVLIYNKTRKKHDEVIKEIRQLRDRIEGNNQQIKKITRAIKKDKNEDMYELGDFDEKISSIDGEIQRINSEKEAALINFDDNIRPSIVSEIESKEMPRINDLENNLNEAIKDKETMEAVVKETTLKITSEYEAYIGKEFTNIDKLNELVKIMEGGQAKTISQAIDIYKSQP